MQTVHTPAQQYAHNIELDALLAGSNSSKPDAAPSAEGLSFLDDLLAESMAAKRDATSVKAARSLLAGNAKLNPEARKGMEESIRVWETKREWHSRSCVAMYTRQFCEKCDLYHTTFSGFFERQEHRQTKVTRWVKNVPGQMKLLPKEVLYEDEIAEMCEGCAKAAGYPIED